MENLTFEQLPKAVTLLSEKINEVRDLLLKQSKQSEPKPDKFLTIKEAALFLSLTVPTMYSKVSKGELPVMKRGKRLYFLQSELLEYIKGGKKKSTSEIEQEAKAYLSNKKGLNNGK